MKTASATCLLAAIVSASLGLVTWAGAQTPAPAPTGTVPPGPTSVTGSIGVTVYNGVVYLIREGAVTKIDAANIPAGHMMTLDGRLEPLPPGVKLPGTALPEAEE